MALPMGARTMVRRVRQITQDATGLAWSDGEVLEAVDSVLGDIMSSLATSGQQHHIDRLDVQVASFTKVEDLWFEYDLPEYVQAIRAVHGVRGTAPGAYVIFKSTLEDMGPGVAPITSSYPTWTMTRHSQTGRISLFGAPLSSFTAIRFWFIRRHPPLHFGTGPAGPGSISTLVFNTSGTGGAGDVVNRPGLYEGLTVEFETGTFHRRITAFDDATSTATLGSSVTVVANEPYSIVVPVDPEHLEYLMWKTADHLLSRAGNLEYMATIAPKLARLEAKFTTSMSRRDVSGPRRLWSTR